MPKKYSIAEAKNHLPAIVHEVEKAQVIELTRRGQPVAVIIAKQEYDRLQAHGVGFWQAYEAFTAAVDLTDLQLKPDELFDDLRDVDSGREISL